VLQGSQDEHQRLVLRWSEAFLSHQLPEVSPGGPLDLGPPHLRHCCEQAVDLICRVVDLEYRILEYVLEVKCCEGPQAAAPARLYYARMGEQRKVDDVEFTAPRWRPSSGVAVWEPGKAFQFRLTGRCERCPLTTLGGTPWQVASAWSDPAVLSPRVSSGRTGSRSMLDKAEVRAYFEHLGLDAGDAWDLFKILDQDESSYINLDEFTTGCLRLKGPAKVIDVEKLQYENKHMRRRLWAFMKQTEQGVSQIKGAISRVENAAPTYLQSPVFSRSMNNLHSPALSRETTASVSPLKKARVAVYI